jgi:hypothetical protein
MYMSDLPPEEAFHSVGTVPSQKADNCHLCGQSVPAPIMKLPFQVASVLSCTEAPFLFLRRYRATSLWA